MSPNGPIYCETGHPWLFMAEPVNTITNGFIILAAIMAFVLVRRARIGFPPGIAVLLFLLLATGIGSFFWHAFRTRTALAFDAIPGLMFLFVFSGLWMCRLFGTMIGIFGAIAMVAASIGSVWLWRHFMGDVLPGQMAFVPAFVTIAVIGAGLVVSTTHKYGASTASLGTVTLVCAISAAAARSVDLMTCSVIPFGTHFLWHIGLSTAAYLGIALLVRMKARGRAMFG